MTSTRRNKETSRLGIEDTIKKHPAVYYFSSLITMFGLAFGVTRYFADQSEDRYRENFDATLAAEELASAQELNQRSGQYDATIDAFADARETEVAVYEATVGALSMALSSIERGAGQNRAEAYLDISQLKLNPDDPDQAKLVAGAEEGVRRGTLQLFEADSFYAPSADPAATPGVEPPAAGWSYAVTDEGQLIADLTGQTEAYSAMGVTDEQLALMPIHLWRKSEANQIEGASPLITLYAQVIVQRYPRAQLMAVVETAAAAVAGAASSPETPNPWVEAILDIYGTGDAAGYLICSTVVGNVNIFPSEVKSLQKKGDVAYARLLTTFSNVTVNGVRHDRYYLTQELLFISTPEDLYMIRTSLPSATLTSPDSLWISTWLASFHVLANS